MNKIKLILVFILLASLATVFAQTSAIGFRDATTGTRTLARLQDPLYPNSTPVGYARFLIQMYKSTDNVISPLGSDGLPTGDDVVSTLSSPANGSMTLAFSPTGTWSPSNYVFAVNGSTGNTWRGDKVYLRIYNAATIAAATYYAEFNGLYTVPTSNATPSILVAPVNGWSTWKLKAVTPLVSGAITSPLSVTGVTVACTGMSNVTTTASGLFSFSVVPGANITITPSKNGYLFTPASRTYSNVTEAIPNVDFAMIKAAANNPTTPVPYNTAGGIEVTLGQVGWSFTPAAGYSLPTSFKVYFPSNTLTPTIVPYVSGTTTYTLPIPLLTYSTLYNWKVIPTNNNAKSIGGTVSVFAGSKDNTKTDTDNIIEWSFTTEAAQIITPGIPEAVDPDGSGSLGYFTFNTPNTDVVPTTPVIVYTLIPVISVPDLLRPEYMTSSFAMNLHASGSTSMTVTVPVGRWFVNAYYGGAWHHGDPYPAVGPWVVEFNNIPFGAKGDVPIVVSSGGDPTLPVELSSFTAVFNQSLFVQLTWVVQSETNHLGYNVMRSNTEELSDAVIVNPEFISNGSVSGTQVTYSYRDDQELENNSTYYYWLNSVDLDGTEYFFGPVNVLVHNDGEPIVPPVIPAKTELLSAYPNPFDITMSTTIPYTLKEQGQVKIDVYNVKGQVIKSFNTNHAKAGYYTAEWNGKDNNGKQVSSGIYFYRMTSGKFTASKKIILVK